MIRQVNDWINISCTSIPYFNAVISIVVEWEQTRILHASCLDIPFDIAPIITILLSGHAKHILLALKIKRKVALMILGLCCWWPLCSRCEVAGACRQGWHLGCCAWGPWCMLPSPHGWWENGCLSDETASVNNTFSWGIDRDWETSPENPNRQLASIMAQSWPSIKLQVRPGVLSYREPRRKREYRTHCIRSRLDHLFQCFFSVSHRIRHRYSRAP